MEQNINSKVNSIKNIFIILIILILGGVIFAYTKNMQNSNKSVKNAETKDLMSYVETKKMPELEYTNYLDQKITGFDEGGISQNIGFAMIKVHDKSKSPIILGDFGLEIRMVPIPNIVKNNDIDSVNIKITGAFDQSGKNLIRLNDSFDDSFEPIINTKYLEYPSPNILAFASGELSSGSDTDIVKIEGILRLKLPVGELTSTDFVVRDFPFTLAQHQTTPTVIRNDIVSLSPTQIKIQESFSLFRKIIIARDIEEFTKYILILTPLGPTDDIINNEALTEMMNMVDAFLIGDIVPEDFASKNTIWDIKETFATVKINKQNEYGNTSKYTIKFVKINDIWYQNIN